MKAIGKDVVSVLRVEALPNGVVVILTPCADYNVFNSLPFGIEFEGGIYGRSGWNSDRGEAYFRSDYNTAKAVR